MSAVKHSQRSKVRLICLILTMKQKTTQRRITMAQTTKFKNSKAEESSIEVAVILREHIDTYQQTYPLFP
jgi:hypothetical protein